jgi:hypothetical protein
MKFYTIFVPIFTMKIGVKIVKKIIRIRKMEIKVGFGEVRKLMKKHKVSAPTVRAALKYKSNTLLAQKIRSSAKASGGRDIEYVTDDKSGVI